jgi:hypothetical protein
MVGETLTLDRFLSNLNTPVTYDEVQDVAYELRDFIKNDPRSTVDTPIPNDPTFKVFTLSDHPHTYELREERNGSFAAYVSPPAEDYPTYARLFSKDEVCHLQYGGTAVESNRYKGVVSIFQGGQGSTKVRVYPKDGRVSRVEFSLPTPLPTRVVIDQPLPARVVIDQQTFSVEGVGEPKNFRVEEAQRRLHQKRLGWVLDDLKAIPF